MPVLPLEGDVWGSGDELATPGSILIVDSLLVVIDRKNDKQLSIFSKRTGHLLGSFGIKGSGPGEYRAPWTVSADPARKGRLWVFDRQLRRLTSVDVGRLPLAPGFPKAETHALNRSLTEVIALRSGLFLGANPAADSARITVLSAGGDVSAHLAPLPPRPADIPLGVWQQAQQVHIAVAPSRRQVVTASRHADRIEIFDDSGRPVGTAERFFAFEPRFERGAMSIASAGDRVVMAQGDDTRIGYVSLTLSNRFIYALFSGTVTGASMTATYGAYLHVFDYAGKSRGVYKFQGPVASIAVEPDDSRLYATRHDPEPAILVYRLPSVR
ncbi:MAG: TolB-like 6-bladed beta-propeller domain-containing protein [Gemmatimonadetes bacterium]|nr:TolB-like 6-bladed beta-propeller domain-containing protein [Gemmatimonadota bacterium]